MPIDTNMLMYMLAGTGAAIGGEGSIAESVGGMTQQAIGTQNYAKMIKTLLAGGAKVNMDKENVNIKAPTSLFGEKGVQLPGAAEGLAGIQGVPTPTAPTSNVPGVINPSASPLDISGAGLAGLTPQDISQALQLKFGAEELRRKTAADVSEAAYRGTAVRKMEAETIALTPSITVPKVGLLDFGKLTRGEALDWYKTATKDERATGVEYYEYYVAQEKAAGTPNSKIKSFEKWFMSVKKAEGGIPEFVAKRRIGKEIDIESELAAPDYPQTISEDLKKRDHMAWGDPPMYKVLSKKKDKAGKRLFTDAQAIKYGQRAMVIDEYDARIRSFYELKGKKVEKRVDGWYIDGVLKVRNPYAKR